MVRSSTLHFFRYHNSRSRARFSGALCEVWTYSQGCSVAERMPWRQWFVRIALFPRRSRANAITLTNQTGFQTPRQNNVIWRSLCKRCCHVSRSIPEPTHFKYRCRVERKFAEILRLRESNANHISLTLQMRRSPTNYLRTGWRGPAVFGVWDRDDGSCSTRHGKPGGR